MPLIKETIKSDILTVLSQAEANALSDQDAKNVFADNLAEAIIKAIKSQEINITATAGGDPVVVASIEIS